MISTILAPTDGSEHARKAMAFACDLAGTYHARLIILHVLVPGHLAETLVALDAARASERADADLARAVADKRIGEITGTAGAEARPPLLRHVAERVIADAESMARLKGVRSVRGFIEDGDPVQRILEYADKENADLIVMGSRGLSDIEGLAVGSTSHKISHLSRCTVVSVK